jgi:hypothetical protein
MYISEFRKAHICLSDLKEEIVWFFNKAGGWYSAKLGYMTLQVLGENLVCWWYKKLWKIRGPLKGILGLGLCYLCKRNVEVLLSHKFRLDKARPKP